MTILQTTTEEGLREHTFLIFSGVLHSSIVPATIGYLFLETNIIIALLMPIIYTIICTAYHASFYTKTRLGYYLFFLGINIYLIIQGVNI